MGRVERALLLAFAVMVLSAVPGGDADALRRTEPSGAAVWDPSQQLSSGVPAARGDQSRTAAADVGGRFDRVDPRTRQLTAAVVPVVEIASQPVVDHNFDGSEQWRVCTVATGASGRGPPSELAQTLI